MQCSAIQCNPMQCNPMQFNAFKTLSSCCSCCESISNNNRGEPRYWHPHLGQWKTRARNFEKQHKLWQLKNVWKRFGLICPSCHIRISVGALLSICGIQSITTSFSRTKLKQTNFCQKFNQFRKVASPGQSGRFEGERCNFLSHCMTHSPPLTKK